MTSERNLRAFKALETYTDKITKTKESAKRALVQEGIYTREGKLTVEYGGRKPKKATAAG